MPVASSAIADREIIISRLFDAPPSLVCEAFLQRDEVALWWGPVGFRITTESFDARPGGRWVFVMHGPDGTDYPNTIEYRVIDPPHRLVFVHIKADGTELFETTTTFVEEKGKTRMTFRALFPSKDVLEQVVRDHQAYRGAQQHLAKLARHLEQRIEGERAALEVVNRRVFHVPAARVFAAFADADQLAQWWGPDGFTNTFEHCDFSPGGEWRYTMHGPNGADFFNVSEFVDIVPDARVVIDHLRPMHRFTLTITLDERESKTTLVWRQRFATEAEFAEIREFLFHANEQNLDRLGRVLGAGDSGWPGATRP